MSDTTGTANTTDTISKEQLDALFDFKQAFPNMSWNIGVDNVLRMETWLTGGEARFLREATQMMAPVSETCACQPGCRCAAGCGTCPDPNFEED